jgi:hypothetical protein
MADQRPLAWRVAWGLAAHAARILPPERREWSQAMIAEVDHLPSAGAAMRWAIGCVFAGYIERTRSMIGTAGHVSRWVLSLEMLLCFAPLTIAWLDGIFGVSGIVRPNAHLARGPSFSVPGVTLIVLVMIGRTILTSLGPISLIAAFRQLALGRSICTEWLRVAMVAAPILYGLLEVYIRFSYGGSAAFLFSAADIAHFWSGMLLTTVLPSIGAAHLLRLGPPTSPAP